MNNEDLMDLFAGLAMQGIVSLNGHDLYTDVARHSYLIAEAMIAEKEKRHERNRPD